MPNILLFLLSVLKDVPNIPVESYGARQRDSVRQSIFPTLNYSGLYQAVLSILDLMPVVQIGQLGMCSHFLHFYLYLHHLLRYLLLIIVDLFYAFNHLFIVFLHHILLMF